MDISHQSQIAVFIDIENFLNFCIEFGLPMDLTSIFEKIQDEGKIVVRRSFGDINRVMDACRRSKDANRVRRMMRDLLVSHTDVVYTNNYKNSADMRLAVDALSVCYTSQQITKFAVISADSDYVPLFEKLKENSRTVIGISGTKERTHVIYARSCDLLYYYDDIYRSSVGQLDLPLSESGMSEQGMSSIDGQAQAEIEDDSMFATENIVAETAHIRVSEDKVSSETAPGEAGPVDDTSSGNYSDTESVIIDQPTVYPLSESPVPGGIPLTRGQFLGPSSKSYEAGNENPEPVVSPFDLQTVRDEYANLVVQAVRHLEQTGNQVPLHMIAPQIRAMQSDFDIDRGRFSSLIDLAKFTQERGLIKLQQRGGEYFVTLPAGASNSHQEVSTAQYRQFLQDRLKCTLPTFVQRVRICEESFAQIGYNLTDGGIFLSDLSRDVAEDLAFKNLNIPQESVYKYLLSLLKARCFEYESFGAGDYNPRITGLKSQMDQWDDRFVAAQMKFMVDYGDLPLFTLKLAQLFYENEEKISHIRRLLNHHSLNYVD